MRVSYCLLMCSTCDTNILSLCTKLPLLFLNLFQIGKFRFANHHSVNTHTVPLYFTWQNTKKIAFLFLTFIMFQNLVDKRQIQPSNNKAVKNFSISEMPIITYNHFSELNIRSNFQNDKHMTRILKHANYIKWLQIRYRTFYLEFFIIHVTAGVFTALYMQITGWQVVTSCNLATGYKHLKEISCLHA
jgi:hypothetical protein